MSQYSRLLRAIADGKRLETAYAGDWHPMTEKAAFERMARGDDIEWREAPKAVRQVACDVPAPMVEALYYGQIYFVPDILEPTLYRLFSWNNDSVDEQMLNSGLCYLRRIDAQARARAMLQIEAQIEA